MESKVFNGHTFEVVVQNAKKNTGFQNPLKQSLTDETIFIAIPSFRDGLRCSKTIRTIFESASEPDKIFVGLVEQNDPEDVSCLSEYCKFYGAKNVKTKKLRRDMTKILVEEGREGKCPRFNQIRYIATFDYGSNGPNGARALSRKLLGNEEFCMHVDAHTLFVPRWDKIAKEEWKNIENEFAVISTMPAKISEINRYNPLSGDKKGVVPRQCRVRIADNGIPAFSKPADGYAVDLERPLLGHTWSSAFSFSKCHLEETVPYDPFTKYVFGAEQFSRYARMWTRGYDVYTPTKNIVYHNYEPNPDGHDKNEWFKKRREQVRQQSLFRIKLFLGIRDEEGSDMEVAHANLGIYGLGKRRSLKQLQEFIGIDLKNTIGKKTNLNCSNKSWIPYDASISPMQNLYTKVTDLDPQPVFPLRDKFVFFTETKIDLDNYTVANIHSTSELLLPISISPNNSQPTLILPIICFFGLTVLWCMVFCRQIEFTTNWPTNRNPKKKAVATKEARLLS